LTATQQLICIRRMNLVSEIQGDCLLLNFDVRTKPLFPVVLSYIGDVAL